MGGDAKQKRSIAEKIPSHRVARGVWLKTTVDKFEATGHTNVIFVCCWSSWPIPHVFRWWEHQRRWEGLLRTMNSEPLTKREEVKEMTKKLMLGIILASLFLMTNLALAGERASLGPTIAKTTTVPSDCGCLNKDKALTSPGLKADVLPESPILTVYQCRHRVCGWRYVPNWGWDYRCWCLDFAFRWTGNRFISSISCREPIRGMEGWLVIKPAFHDLACCKSS